MLDVALGRLDAVVVGAPVGDGLFDGFGFELLGEGAVGEGGDLFVGGEAEGDELADGELVEVGKSFAGTSEARRRRSSRRMMRSCSLRSLMRHLKARTKSASETMMDQWPSRVVGQKWMAT